MFDYLEHKFWLNWKVGVIPGSVIKGRCFLELGRKKLMKLHQFLVWLTLVCWFILVGIVFKNSPLYLRQCFLWKLLGIRKIKTNINLIKYIKLVGNCNYLHSWLGLLRSQKTNGAGNLLEQQGGYRPKRFYLNYIKIYLYNEPESFPR